MMACASGSILKSLSAAQLDKLKNQVVDLLQSSEGRLDLCLFKKGYKDFYKKKFDQQFGSLRSKKLKDVMAELDDVVSLEKIGSSVIIVLKVTEELCDTSVSKDVDSAEKYKANSTLPDLKSQEVDLDSKVPLSSSVKPDRGETHPSVPGLDVKSPDPGKPKNVPAGESYSQPAKQKAAKGLQMTPPQVPTGGKNKHAGPCFSEIMQQQEQEERLADEGDHSVPTGYERLLCEVQATPSPVKRTAVHSTPELKDARVRKIGPGPFEKSFDHAQQLLSTVKPKPTLKHLSLVEVNTAAENIITSLSEDGKFVSLELVKAKLCKQFGKKSVSALGFRRDKDIPALNDLIQLQNKVSLFVHAYVMSNSIATLYELGQSLVDLISRQDSSKQDFEDLRLGPLLQQPVVYDMFKAPSSLPSPPHITTIQILKHLEKYMTEENLWREKVDLKKFMEYLCEERGCDTPYELGVRIQSVGLAISVIRQAKRSDRERWKAAREEVSAGMDEDIQRQLRKIKKDLLGQELGDLRSSVMRILDASPVDALNKLFSCCLQLFEGKHQKKITDFFTYITRHALGRHLFQLALNTSCKGLVGDAVEQMVADEVEKRVADNARQSQEKDTRPVAPSEGVVLKEVSAWLANADNIDLSTLATIESTVMNKFPEFNSFEELGYGSFLKFLTSHKELLEAIKQVGGLAMAGSGGLGTKVGHQVLANSVLDFISQCGTQASPEMVERNLCTYYSINKVTDLGFGALSNLLTKASGRQKNMTGMNAHSIVYETALMCHLPGTNEDSGNRTTGSALGYMSKEDAIAAIRSTPLLEDVALWTHWDEVFGGEVSALGDLKSFLEKERILINAGKSTPGKHGSLVVVETSPGVLLRVTTNTSPEIFKECACRGDSVGAAGHLVSMVMVNGGVANTPVALLANHIQSSLASMVVLGGNDGLCDFVLECLVRMPRKLAQAVGTKVFLEPLKKLVGSTDAPSLLLSSCSTHHQRSRLHRLGFVLGVSQWIEDFQSRVSAQNEEELKPEEEQGEHQTRPLAVVRPIQFTNKQTRQTEESVTTIEDEMSTPLSETSVKEDEQEVSSDADNDSQVQLTSLTTDQEICRAVIEQIRREEFGIGLKLGEEESKLVQRQREREGRGLHRLSTELYSRDTHFVLELVQNADDNSYPEEGCSVGFPSLIFVLQQDRIVVLNNEVGFMEKNIRALCDVGKSTKGAHRYGYIGQKGIGFKSVFRVSDCPEVHSNGFHIRFDAKSGPIGYILPQWIEERSEEEPICEEGVEKLTEDNSEREVHPVSSEYDGWSTRIVLPLKEELQGMEERSLAARFRDVHPSLLLFLHRLRAISIRDQVNNTRHEMIRTDLGDKIMEISHTKGTDRWLVVKKELDASNIKRDVEMTELALAFPLFRDTDQDTSLGRKHQSLPQQYVFAYLPLRSYGFRFIIQGDFEVPSSREDVDSDKSWNQWLREEIPQLFVDAMSVFMDHPSFSAGLSSVASYFQFVPLEEEILDFFTPVARRILTLLQGKTCIPVKETKQEANSFNWVLPCKAVLCQDSTTLELITPALLEKHLGLRYLHSDIAPALNPTLRSRLGIETLSSKHLLEIGKAEAKKFTADEDPRPEVVKITWLARWFQCMYRCLEQERNSSQDILDLISSLSVIPLTDGTFVNLKGDSVFLPLSLKKSSAATAPKKVTGSSTEQTCFSVLERDLSTVHPVLFSSLDDIGRSQVEQLLRLLGVKSWSARDLINSHIVPTLNSDKWKAKSNEVLRSYLVYILEQRLSDPSVCDVDQLRSCVQILTNKGPLNPTETPIHFTPRFGNTVDLARHLPSISWTLVDDSYLDASTKARSTDWKAFLADLGVQSFLSIKKKQVKLHRSNMSQSPWASCEPIWQTTPDGMYVIEDWSCEEFEEFIGNVTTSGDESTVLAQCIDERWNNEYSQYADGLVHVKDSNGHTLNETKSSFYLNLVSKPWMSARGEASNLFIPRDLFIRGENVNRLLEDHVKYTAADLKNSAFISVLHIRESISADGMISEMKKWSSVQSRDAVEGGQSKVFITSLAHMREVYSFLFERMSHNEDERKKINEAFHKNALIFVPHHYQDSSSKQVHMGNRMQGSFYLKKDVCWRDPTDVASKLLKDHGKVTTRHLLHGYYHRTSAQQSFAAFFVDELNVEETPTMNEYLELAATIADIGRFPTPPSLKNMLKIFSALGKKCIARCHNDCVGEENEIDLKMAAFLKQSLEREEKNIFPCRGKWVSLSDKPLLADEKSLLKIFQKLKEKDPLVGEDGKEKKKCVFFLDFGDFFESSKQLDRKQEREREETKQNVSIFLKICEVKALTECVQKEFIPTLVQYHCAPLQKYFHQLMPHVQRFLHSKNSQVYKDLKRKRFAEKLGQMQFASVESLETVYSLSTHPDVLVSIKEKSGLQSVGSSFCLYVVHDCLEKSNVLNTEIVKLVLGEKNQSSPELHNFLVAVKIYDGSDFDSFLEDIQGLKPLPDDEELWYVPPPEEPDVVEAEEEAPVELPSTLHPSTPGSYRSGDDGLHSWPPKSAVQYDKTRKCEGDPGDSVLNVWPPPAPPESMKPTREEQIQGKATPRDARFLERPKEHEGNVREDEASIRQHHPPSQSVAIQEPAAERISPNGQHVRATDEDLAHHEQANVQQAAAIQGQTPGETAHQPGFQSAANSAIAEGVTEAGLPNDPHANENTVPATVQINPQPLQISLPPGEIRLINDLGLQARSINSSHAYLWFDSGIQNLDFEDFSFPSDTKVFDRIPLLDATSREDVGRWGEQCVYEFLLNQTKFLPQDVKVDIVWVNKKGNTTRPYDLEIRRHIVGVEGEVITYVEVKTTTSDQKDIFEISVQEIQFALTNQQAFHLYRVFNAGNPSCLRIRRLQNLAAHLEGKNVKLCLMI